jgi:DNA polymerase-3 subunit alpha
LAYQTAYLKANFPAEFMAASMTLDIGNTDKLMLFRREGAKLGVRIRAPSINSSGAGFEVKDGSIHYSLAALKNVGRGAIEYLVAVRAAGGPFVSLGDFARRIDGHVLNKRALESLAKAGVFDALNPNRRQVCEGVETILAAASRSAAAAEAGQGDLFGLSALDAPDGGLRLPAVEPWLPMERLAAEFEAVGFYLSGHPLDDYMKQLARIGVESWAAFHDKVLNGQGSVAKLAGTVTYKQERRSKNGNRFAFVGFSDPSGQFETVVFSDTLAVSRDFLETGKAVIAKVEADIDGEEVRLRLQEVEPLEQATAGLQTGITIFLKDASPVESIARRLVNGGRAPVRVILQLPGEREVTIALGTSFSVTPQVKSAIKAIPGVIDVQDF